MWGRGALLFTYFGVKFWDFKEVYKKSMKISDLVELCLGGKTVFNNVTSVMEFKAKHCFKVM